MRPRASLLPALFLMFLTVPAMSGADTVRVAPYGTWTSTLKAADIAAGGSRLDNVRVAAGRLYWTENLPTDGGRIALFAKAPGAEARELTSGGANVRTRVHEYGGAPYVVAGSRVYYSQFDDQRLYELAPGAKRRAITPDGFRYADCALVPGTEAAPVLVCVREEHRADGSVHNTIVRLDTAAGGPGEVLYGDTDFVAYPRVDPRGYLAFIAWSHPHMPWDGTRLFVGRLGAGGLSDLKTVAGGDSEAILEPQWADDGTLYFLSDRTDFWNLYRLTAAGAVEPVAPRAAEFGGPLWTLGQANYVLLGHGRAVASYAVDNVGHLALIDLKTGATSPFTLPYVDFSQLQVLDAGHVVFLGAPATSPRELVKLEVATGRVEVQRRATTKSPLAAESVSVGEPIDYPSAAGRVAHAFFYAPRNAQFAAPANTLPPLIALVHGGPTSGALPAYTASIQYWTTRGFAVVDVNYGGSSGYGRAYRQRLNGQWGVVDVEDVVAAVRYLASSGRADPMRTAISGGSAGGYTVLLALATTDVFHAGADFYGISDMTALAKDTHKFESRYLDSLIGPLPAAQAVYDARSPLSHLEGFHAPLIVFQGADDPVVPPAQSERIVAAQGAQGAGGVRALPR